MPLRSSFRRRVKQKRLSTFSLQCTAIYLVQRLLFLLLFSVRRDELVVQAPWSLLRMRGGVHVRAKHPVA